MTDLDSIRKSAGLDHVPPTPDEQARAARLVVARYARGREELLELLGMLGLDDVETRSER